MNEQGNILFIIAGMLIFILAVPLIMHVFPFAGLVFQIMMIFIIYSMVRGYLGQNIMSLVVSAVLIYLLVFKYRDLTATVWVVQIMLSVSFFSVIIWGIGTRMRGGAG
jgi:hypothetical protein